MIFYHGTARIYLDSILKKGLIPQANSWEADWPTWMAGGSITSTESKGSIYLSKFHTIAEAFAHLRAIYLSAKPGSVFGYTNRNFICEGFRKDLKAPVIHTTPVVLQVTLEHPKLTFDPNCVYHGRHSGYLYPGVIPPTALKVL